jgi:type IV secretion system protein VirD4
MHYNPFAYIHSEKDILKLVTTLIANTKGEGKSGDDFWVKAETLLYCALIGYIHYEAPVEEQNATLIEFINASEVRDLRSVDKFDQRGTFSTDSGSRSVRSKVTSRL